MLIASDRLLNLFSAGTVLRRQNLTPIDVRFLGAVQQLRNARRVGVKGCATELSQSNVKKRYEEGEGQKSSKTALRDC